MDSILPKLAVRRQGEPLFHSEVWEKACIAITRSKQEIYPAGIRGFSSHLEDPEIRLYKALPNELNSSHRFIFTEFLPRLRFILQLATLRMSAEIRACLKLWPKESLQLT
jgi:hypothetical protein